MKIKSRFLAEPKNIPEVCSTFRPYFNGGTPGTVLCALGTSVSGKKYERLCEALISGIRKDLFKLRMIYYEGGRLAPPEVQGQADI